MPKLDKYSERYPKESKELARKIKKELLEKVRPELEKAYSNKDEKYRLKLLYRLIAGTGLLEAGEEPEESPVAGKDSISPRSAHTELEFIERASRNKAYQAACRKDPYAGYLATSKAIRHSSDGLTWETLLSLDNIPVPAPINVTCVLNTDWIVIYLESKRTEAIETMNGGKTWEYVIYHNKQREVKLRTHDRGKTWL